MRKEKASTFDRLEDLRGWLDGAEVGDGFKIAPSEALASDGFCKHSVRL